MRFWTTLPDRRQFRVRRTCLVRQVAAAGAAFVP